MVEGETAPKTFVAGCFLAIATPLAQEPIGQRIVEVPDDLARFESRDPRVTFTAYVPSGSISKGKALVTRQDPSKTPLACATCHGKDLRGVGAYPSIAGRSPTYIFRQLYELQTGVRAGPGAHVMKPKRGKAQPERHDCHCGLFGDAQALRTLANLEGGSSCRVLAKVSPMSRE